MTPVIEPASQVTELDVFDHTTLALADDFDGVPGFAVGEGILEMFTECCHETVEVPQLWGIIIMKVDLAVASSMAFLTHLTLPSSVDILGPYPCK